MPTMSPNPSSQRATRSPTTTSTKPSFSGRPRRQGWERYAPLRRDVVPCQVFEHSHQPRVIPALAAECGGGVEQLLGRRRIGQREAERPRPLQGEVQILLVQFDAEAGVECALDHPLAMDFED